MIAVTDTGSERAPPHSIGHLSRSQPKASARERASGSVKSMASWPIVWTRRNLQ
jgi:hypothetical protein